MSILPFCLLIEAVVLMVWVIGAGLVRGKGFLWGRRLPYRIKLWYLWVLPAPSVCCFTIVEPDQQYLLLLQASNRPGRREDWEQRSHIHSDLLQCFRKGLWELYLCGHKQAWEHQCQHHTVWWVQEAWMQLAQPCGEHEGLKREEGKICLACVHPYCSTHHP